MSASLAPTILVFGGYTEPWLESIDCIHQQSISNSWLQSFLDDVASVIRAETKHMHPRIRNSFGSSNFPSIQEVADKYRYAKDDVGFVQCIMSYIVRAVILLRWVHDSPDALSAKPKPEAMGVSGGLINAAVLAVADDFKSLYDASVVAAGLVCRLCEVAGAVSWAVEDSEDGAVWGYAIMGASPAELDKILVRVQESMNTPALKRVRVGISGDHWGTVIGPPSVLEACLAHASLRDLAKQKLPIHSLQHNCDTSRDYHKYIVGHSALHKQPVRSEFRLWGLHGVDDGAESVPRRYANWGKLLLDVADSAFSKPVDLVGSVKRLNTRLDPYRQVQVRVMGSSWFAGSLTKKMKVSGRKVSVVQHDVLGPDCSAEAGQRPGAASLRETYRGRVAIVGMAGRAPDCEDLEQYWHVIEKGQNLAREIPPGRFDADDMFSPSPRHHQEHESQSERTNCTSTSRLGCFIENPGHFDPRFFQISPREALLMDPGSRQFQMAAYEALESAGYSCGTTRATNPSRIAVFYGQSNVDGYETAHHEKGCDAYTLQALGRPFPPSRIAFQYGWEGPTYSIDQACSTSSTLIHMACAGLLSNDFDMAVAGSANMLASPHGWCVLSKADVLSDTGNCKTFRDDADGYCRGEFVGVIVLKRLEDAVAHNDRILAVIPGSARNQSGNSAFLTSSDAAAEERMLQQALRRARLTARDIAYVEMHGTATAVGDPCEMTAVANVLGRRQADENEETLTVGSVKANIGHSEAASGIASVIKSIFMFQKHILPPQAGMPHALNPKFPSLDDHRIRILSKPIPFDSAHGKPRRILINNFDAAGGNTCLLLEEFASDEITNHVHGVGAGEVTGTPADPRSTHVVVLSAKSRNSHLANKRRLVEWLRANPSVRLQDVAYTTTARRMHHSIRFACVVSSTRELIAELESDLAGARGGEAGPYVRGQPTAKSKPPVVFVFSGQGSHYAGMGGELYRTNPVFRTTLDMCKQICYSIGFPPFLDIITGNDSIDLSQKNTVQTQLAVVALEIGLATFWRRLGLEPSLVIGHSLGEYAALHIAGVLSLADALYLVGSRASLAMQKCGKPGACAMLGISASAATVRGVFETLKLDEQSCSVACVNSPTSSVVSGTVDAVAQLQAAFKGQNIRAKMLPLPYGFHSFQVDSILEDFVSLAAGTITYSPPRIPVASTLLASVIEPATAARNTFTAEYLGKQTRHIVDFVGALRAVKARFEGVSNLIWLEVGPTRVCGSFVQETLSPPSELVMSTLRAGVSSWAPISECLAVIYRHGIDLDWLGLHAPFETSLRLLTLPTYAWDVKDYWIAYKYRKDSNGMAHANGTPASTVSWPISICAQYIYEKSKHPKVEVTLGASIAQPVLRALIDSHRMQDVGLCPGSVFCEAALVAARCALEYSGAESPRIEDLSLRKASLVRPLTLDLVGPNGELHTTAVVESESLVLVSFKASSQSPAQSYDLGTCAILVRNAADLQASWDLDSFYINARMHEIIRTCANRLQTRAFYAVFSRTVEYRSDAYKCIRDAYVSEDFNEAVAEVVLANDIRGMQSIGLSPCWGEALAHLAGFLVNCHPSRRGTPTTTFVMNSLESYDQTVAIEPGRSYFTYSRIYKRETNTALCEIVVFDAANKVVMRTSRMQFHELRNDALEALRSSNKPQVPSGRGFSGSDSVLQTAPLSPTHPPASSPTITRTDVPTSANPEETIEINPNTHAGPRELVFQGNNNEDVRQVAVADEFELLQVILSSIAEETGLDTSEITDDTALSELGVDSIMAVEICARVKERSHYNLSPSFILDFPTIDHLVRRFGATKRQQEPHRIHHHEQQQQQEHRTSSNRDNKNTMSEAIGRNGTSGRVEITNEFNKLLGPVARRPSPPASSNSPPSLPPPKVQPDDTRSELSSVENSGPPLKARIMLLQGRPEADQTRLYLICDGCGTISNCIHLLKHKFSVSVYGIDSPFFRCPSRLTPQVGIPGIAKLMVSALINFHPESGVSGSIVLGGFSGGATLAYEICRQLAELGRKVNGLLLLDMRCPLPPLRPGGNNTELVSGSPGLDEDAWNIVVDVTLETHAGQTLGWNPNSAEHLRATFACVAEYHPPPLAAGGLAFRCPAVVIWCAKGMVGRIVDRPELLSKLREHGFTLESYPGYMEDPKLGAVGWSLPHKRTESDFGPGGWEKFVGAGDDGEIGKHLLCLSIDADHHDLMRPPLTARTHAAMEQGLAFLLGKREAQ